MEYSTYYNALCACYRDIASAYPAQYSKEQKRDLACLAHRYATEGLGFLTKTLPALAKAIDTALANRTILQVPSFARRKGSKLPRFLGWLIGMVFSSEGTELDHSNPVALVHIRQFLYLLYKLEMPYTSDEESEFLANFVEVDSSLNTGWDISGPAHASEVRFAADLISRVLCECDPRLIRPKHGPGSVATGEKRSQKSYFSRAYESIEEFYPLDEYFYMNANHLSARYDSGLMVKSHRTKRLLPWENCKTGTAKVVLVPKDSRGPRLISMEPLEIQWIQQGQRECLQRHLETHWLTKHHINFAYQGINRCLAHLGSMVDGVPPGIPGPIKAEYDLPESWSPPADANQLVTIDMKEASDRVSLQHIYTLFPSNWIQALEASRSTHTKLPNGETVSLNKFAPMGSAVCFPIEALVFWAVSLAAIMHTHPGLSLARAKNRIWVYGDDIICYRKDYPIIKQRLEAIGLRLNASKCCVAGFFRESCGLDAYKGVVVTPLRIKKRTLSRWTPQIALAYISYSNEAYARGYHELAFFLEKEVQRHYAVPYSTVKHSGAQFVRPHHNVRALNKRSRVRTRFSRSLHCYQAYGLKPRPVIDCDPYVSYETYLTRFLSNYRDDSSDRPTPLKDGGGEPEQYSVSRRVSSHRGWTNITL